MLSKRRDTIVFGVVLRESRFEVIRVAGGSPCFELRQAELITAAVFGAMWQKAVWASDSGWGKSQKFRRLLSVF